jgi:hypothetical protein
MGKLNVGGIVYDNPKQVAQSSVVFPDCGDAGQYPPNFPSRTGKVWQREPIQTGVPGLFPVSTDFPGPASPQPGTFEATPPQAPPLAINQDPPVAGKGKPISVSGTSGSTGNPTTDLVRKVVGQVPNGPAFANPS